MEAYKFGPNDIFVEDDLVFAVVHGVASLEATKGYLALTSEVAARHGQVVQLTDVTWGFGLAPETRRYAAEWAKTNHVVASAIFGANAPTRAMLLLVTRAMSLLAGYKTTTHFLATEAAARAWLDPFRLPAFRNKRP